MIVPGVWVIFVELLVSPSDVLVPLCVFPGAIEALIVSASVGVGFLSVVVAVFLVVLCMLAIVVVRVVTIIMRERSSSRNRNDENSSYP